ncbi:MAG TPA: isochorismatase family protein [Jiangellales bacterium]|nr:isochorismatase family protein [Jiangellales bacterium]
MMTPSDLADDYDAHGFRARLGPGARLAVLVIDISRAYLDRDSPLYARVDDAVTAAARVVEAARESGVPVLFTAVRYPRGATAATVWRRKIPALQVFEEGSPLGDFPDSPRPQSGESVIVKHHASAFFGTDLAARLQARGLDTLIITGLSTSGCVRASVVDAVSHDFLPLVVREAVGDRDSRPHEAALFDIDAKYGDVIGIETALALLAAAQR